jgi:hypothetical protein
MLWLPLPRFGSRIKPAEDSRDLRTLTFIKNKVVEAGWKQASDQREN